MPTDLNLFASNMAAYSECMITQSLIFAVVTQIAAIEGQVRDGRTYDSIPAARVELLRAQTPVAIRYTDAAGRFRFESVHGSGRYSISVASAGFEPAALEVDMFLDSGPIVVALFPKKVAPSRGRNVISIREYMVPKDASKKFETARKDARRGKWSSAARHFENGLSIYPNDASAHNDLGNCYRQLGELDPAENAFKRAMALSDSVYIAMNLAELYSVQKRFKEAENVLLDAIQKQPQAGDGYYGLALVYFQQGRLDDAEAAARHAHERVHRIADVHVVLAKIYSDRHEAALAAEQLRTFQREKAK
jgi:tetratricopeptide (TPR) repeat protein